MFIFKLHVTMHGTGNKCLYVSDSPSLFVAHYPERVNHTDSIEALQGNGETLKQKTISFVSDVAALRRRPRSARREVSVTLYVP